MCCFIAPSGWAMRQLLPPLQAKSFQKERLVMEHVKENPEDCGFDYYFGLTAAASGELSDSSDSESN